MTGVKATLVRVSRSIRAILGVPDYDSYVAHMVSCHGNAEVLSREEFVRERTESRYNRPGSRCC